MNGLKRQITSEECPLSSDGKHIFEEMIMGQGRMLMCFECDFIVRLGRNVDRKPKKSKDKQKSCS